MERTWCCWKNTVSRSGKTTLCFFREIRNVFKSIASSCQFCVAPSVRCAIIPCLNIAWEKLWRRTLALSLQDRYYNVTAFIAEVDKSTRAVRFRRFRAFQEDRQYTIHVILLILTENVKDTGSWQGMSKKTNLMEEIIFNWNNRNRITIIVRYTLRWKNSLSWELRMIKIKEQFYVMSEKYVTYKIHFRSDRKSIKLLHKTYKETSKVC